MIGLIDRLALTIAKKLPPNSIDIFRSNSLLLHTFPYYMLLFMEVFGTWQYIHTGNPYLVIFISYGVIPLLD